MSNTIYYYSPVKSIIGIKTNIKNFSFSYGMVMPHVTIEEYFKTLIKIEINVISKVVQPKEEEKVKMGKFHYFMGEINKRNMFYERNFIFNQKLQYKISGIDTNNIEIVVNNNYFRFVKHRFMNIHSIGYILTDIINLRLLHNGFAPLHSSGIEYKKESFIIFAPPNTGKTLTAMTLCMQPNNLYSFISEDLAISDAKYLYSVPWTSTFRYYDSVDKSIFSRLLNKLTEKFSILELFSFGKTEPITKYVETRIDKSKIKGIYILERGEYSIDNISEVDAFDKINTLDRYEFNYMRAPSIIAYEYFNKETDIETAYENERIILKKMIKNAQFVRVISNQNALNYAKMIEKDLKNNL